MRAHRIVSACSGIVLLSGVLAGCGESAKPDTFATGVVTNAVVGGTSFQDSYLVMPHRAVELTGVEVSTVLDSNTVRDLDLGDSELDAADGQEFVVASIDPQGGPYEPDGTAKVEIVTEQGSHDITEDIDGANAQVDQIHVAVSVPKGSTVSLTITDEDKTATMDVRTGKRSAETDADSTGAYYTGWNGEIAGNLESTGVLGAVDPAVAAIIDPGTVNISLLLDGVTPESHPWLTGVGWAAEGQTFMVLGNFAAMTQLSAGACFAGWDPATSIAFTPEGGAAIPPLAYTPDDSGALSIDVQAGLAFAIPLDTAGGVLALSPQTQPSEDCQFYQPMSAAELPITLK